MLLVVTLLARQVHYTMGHAEVFKEVHIGAHCRFAVAGLLGQRIKGHGFAFQEESSSEHSAEVEAYNASPEHEKAREQWRHDFLDRILYIVRAETDHTVNRASNAAR